MSGHSKWHNIQKKKGAADAKRSSTFTKLAKGISVAARQGGGDPNFNFALRVAIDAAKGANMPKDNIDKAIKRGTGEGGEAIIEEVIYEGFAPGGLAILIKCLTDNRNRTVADLKYLASKNGGSIGGVGSVMWMFDKKGVVTFLNPSVVTNRDEFDLAVIDAGAEDIKDNDGILQIICAVEDLKKVTEAVEAMDLKPDGAAIEYLAKDPVAVDDSVKEQLDQFLEILDEYDDVDSLYTNQA
ncbi:YebC/PmpR family DNA-binding transcriptional regulator [Patescibacteria group bacterium]|nr:YebC/PmpR family DNA-binding transcriptional regulator [Patescibacteria group bacterium]MBU1705221.1 YebC/PmpR family DNA-binding transcriptional regulator [Patescibacteria group bacterium]